MSHIVIQVKNMTIDHSVFFVAMRSENGQMRLPDDVIQG